MQGYLLSKIGIQTPNSEAFSLPSFTNVAANRPGSKSAGLTTIRGGVVVRPGLRIRAAEASRSTGQWNGEKGAGGAYPIKHQLKKKIYYEEDEEEEWRRRNYLWRVFFQT
jgi:hypothetical protein